MSLHTEEPIVDIVIITSFWVMVGLAFYTNVDLTRRYFEDALEYGDRVCAPHEGFVSSDHGGDFTCKDGTVIERN